MRAFYYFLLIPLLLFAGCGKDGAGDDDDDRSNPITLPQPNLSLSPSGNGGTKLVSLRLPRKPTPLDRYVTYTQWGEQELGTGLYPYPVVTCPE